MGAPQVGDIVRFTPPARDPAKDAPESDVWRYRRESRQAFLVVGIGLDNSFEGHRNDVKVYERPNRAFGSLDFFYAPADHFTVISTAGHSAEALSALTPKGEVA